MLNPELGSREHRAEGFGRDCVLAGVRFGGRRTALYGANRLDCNSPITAIKVNQESAVYPYNCILFSHRKNEIPMRATDGWTLKAC